MTDLVDARELFEHVLLGEDLFAERAGEVGDRYGERAIVGRKRLLREGKNLLEPFSLLAVLRAQGGFASVPPRIHLANARSELALLEPEMCVELGRETEEQDANGLLGQRKVPSGALLEAFDSRANLFVLFEDLPVYVGKAKRAHG